MSVCFEKWFDNHYDDYGFYPADIADARIVWDAATKAMQSKLDAQAEELAALRGFANLLLFKGDDCTQDLIDYIAEDIGLIDENGNPTSLLTGAKE